MHACLSERSRRRVCGGINHVFICNVCAKEGGRYKVILLFLATLSCMFSLSLCLPPLSFFETPQFEASRFMTGPAGHTSTIPPYVRVLRINRNSHHTPAQHYGTVPE